MTTLADFEKNIDPIILQRGRTYYDDDRVIKLEELTPGYWIAIVEGSSTYHIGITLTPGGSLDWACSCPYDQGSVCKHVTAVLYALKSKKALIPAAKSKPGKKSKSMTDKLREALGVLSKEEMADILLEQALENLELAQMILAHYDPETDSEVGAVHLVRDILFMARDRHGFIDYWGVSQAATELGELLGRADIYLEQGRVEQSLAIFQAVIDELGSTMAHVDDSLGMLSDCLEFAIEGLSEAADRLTADGRAALFNYCKRKANEESLTDWDWGWDLATLAADLVTNAEQKAALFAVLDQMAGRRVGDEWRSEYDWGRAALIKLAVIRQTEDDAAVIAYLEENSGSEIMRLAQAQVLVQQGDFPAARRICEQWLAQAEFSRPGLRAEFLEVLLDIAEESGDRKTQIEIAGTLFQETGYIHYFYLMKKWVGPEEWLAYRTSFIRDLRSVPQMWVDLGELYVREEMWPELLALVQLEPRDVSEYHEALAPHYPQELSEVYEQLALATIEQKVNRKGYKEACRYLLRMGELGQNERLEKVVADLRQKYKQRPALLDELKKAFGPG